MASIVDDVSQFFQRAFPGINNARIAVGNAAASNIGRGDYARAAGNILGGAVRYPLAAADDFVVRPLATVGGGIVGAVGGALGSDGSNVVTPGAARVAVPMPPRAKPVERALAAGAAAPYNIAPRDMLSAYVSSVLKGGATIREAQALGPLVEGTPRPATAKDKVFGTVAAASQDVFASQAQALQAELAAGKITEEQAKAAMGKATDTYLARLSGLLGADPTKLAQAQLLSAQDEED